MAGDITIRSGQCHCGAVRFEARLTDDLASARRCTCSYCRMRGAVVVMAEKGGIRIPHHQRRSNQDLYAVNAACLDGVSPFDFPEVPVMDGVNHTNDTGKPTRRAGTLCFIPAE